MLCYMTAGLLLVFGLAAGQATSEVNDGYYLDEPVRGEISDEPNGRDIQHDCAVFQELSDMAGMPSFTTCGQRFKNLQGGVAATHPELRYSNLGEYPSLAVIRVHLSLITETGKSIDERKTCNGFLITNQHVMTAAHCLEEDPTQRYNRTNREIRVTLGDYNLEVTTQDCVAGEISTVCAPTPLNILVEKIATFPNFDRLSLHHDIAILQLSETVRFNDFIWPICLPYGCGFDLAGDVLHDRVMTHVGWEIFWPNKEKTRIPPKGMQKMKRIVVAAGTTGGDTFDCDKSYLWFDNLTQLCTHEYPLIAEDQINCDAYAGGPLILEYGKAQFAMGLASFGEACGIARSVKNGDPPVMTWLQPYMRWTLRTVYHLKTGKVFSTPFTTPNRWSTGEEED